MIISYIREHEWWGWPKGVLVCHNFKIHTLPFIFWKNIEKIYYRKNEIYKNFLHKIQLYMILGFFNSLVRKRIFLWINFQMIQNFTKKLNEGLFWKIFCTIFVHIFVNFVVMFVPILKILYSTRATAPLFPFYLYNFCIFITFSFMV